MNKKHTNINDHYYKTGIWRETRAGFPNNLIRLNFNAKHVMQNYIYFRQIYQKC